ncbi:MAG: PAC2 family protein [Nanoarchaeota archaeon]|nr:PAC2 family protein [Nanoarchaeota archaeon]
MNEWKLTQIGKKPKLRNPIFIEGLPGIGNVGKIAADFIVDRLKAKKMYDVFSYNFPNSVFVNEDNLVELPVIEIYYKRFKKQDIIILSGDIQPVEEVSSYSFCDKMLDIIEEFKCKEIITLGGIGLAHAPEKPKIYCTANNKEIIKRYKDCNLNEKLFGVVGPIIGVSGLLMGLAKRRNIDAIALLAETFGHPLHIGIKGSREIISILNKKLGLGVSIKQLDKEIEEVEKGLLKKTEQLSEVAKISALKKLKGKLRDENVDYIG